MLAVEYPGRARRRSETFIRSAPEMAAALLPIIASRLVEKPYFIVAHSVGTWITFDLLRLIRQRHLPLPRRIFLSAFPGNLLVPVDVIDFQIDS